MSDKSSEMPLEWIKKRRTAYEELLDSIHPKDSSNPRPAWFNAGFDKCFELMSAAIEEERQASLESYSDLDDINCDLNWKLKEAGEREAKLNAQLDLALSAFKNHALDCSVYTVYSYERLLDKLVAIKTFS